MDRSAEQVATLPYSIGVDGRASVLLVTSRETRRWVIPKGNHMIGIEPNQATAIEAFEEAGVSRLLKKSISRR